MFNVWNSKNILNFLRTQGFKSFYTILLLTIWHLNCSLTQGIFILTISGPFQSVSYISLYFHKNFSPEYPMTGTRSLHPTNIQSQRKSPNMKVLHSKFQQVSGQCRRKWKMEKWKTKKNAHEFIYKCGQQWFGLHHHKNEKEKKSSAITFARNSRQICVGFFEFLLCCRYLHARHYGFRRGLPVTHYYYGSISNQCYLFRRKVPFFYWNILIF